MEDFARFCNRQAAAGLHFLDIKVSGIPFKINFRAAIQFNQNITYPVTLYYTETEGATVIEKLVRMKSKQDDDTFTIDLTPTWASLLQPMLDLWVQYNSSTGPETDKNKKELIEEFKKMAKAADAYIAEIK